MGAFFESTSIPTGDQQAVEKLILEWLSNRGFTPAAGPSVSPVEFDEKDRCGVILLGNARWTIVFYSELEADRLDWELAKLSVPRLRLFVADSDVWGYDVRDGRKTIGGFCSHPHMIPADELPGTIDAEELCSLLKIDERASKVAGKMHKKGLLFKERACTAFCEAVGVPPAANSYRYLEQELMELAPSGDMRIADFSVRHIVLEKEGANPRKFDLHEYEPFPKTQTDRGEPPLSPETTAAMKRKANKSLFYTVASNPLMLLIFLMQMVMVVLMFPLVIVAMWKLKTQADRAEMTGGAGRLEFPGTVSGEPAAVVEGGRLVNRRHRCSIALDGMEPQTEMVVLGFSMKDVATVNCRLIDLKHIAHLIPEQRTSDEKFFCGPHPARWIDLGNGNRGSAARCLVQTSWGIYSFECQSKSALTSEQVAALRKVIATFRAEEKTV